MANLITGTCCACNSADPIQFGTASFGCGDGYSLKYLGKDINCGSIASQDACPTWHDYEIVGTPSMSLSYTEVITGDCCCVYLPGTGGCEEPCPEEGFASITTDFTSDNVTQFNIAPGYASVWVSGTEVQTTITDCQDGSSGVYTIPKAFNIQVDLPSFICSTPNPNCSNTKFSIAYIPAGVTIIGDAETGTASAIGECLPEKGHQCAQDLNVCEGFGDCEGDPGILYSPNISASVELQILNRQGNILAVKDVYPEVAICGLPTYVSCCECRCLAGNYTYNYTLNGTVVVSVGND
jgi:hypothetical protein